MRHLTVGEQKMLTDFKRCLSVTVEGYVHKGNICGIVRAQYRDYVKRLNSRVFDSLLNKGIIEIVEIENKFIAKIKE